MDKLSLETIRNAQPLKRLLWNLKDEEPEMFNKIKSSNYNLDVRLDYNNSFILISNEQIYKTYSIFGLMSNYKRNVKYSVIDINMILSVWYNESEIKKDDILKSQILIIHGKANNKFHENIDDVLAEIYSIRNTMMKCTWIYLIEDYSEDLDSLYPKITSMIKKVTHVKVTPNKIENEQEKVSDGESKDGN
jgi:hypothetical protein